MANHLHPGRRTALSSTGASLPGKTEHFTTSVFQRVYKSSALAIRALNATSLLTAYQAELLEEMEHQLDSGSPNPALWEEICVIADLKLCTSRGAVQSCRWSMGLAVVGARSLWLGLSGLSDKEKVEFLDAPIDPKAMFGTTVMAMCQQCDLRKKEGEAFEVCLPRKPAARPDHPNRPNFRPSGRGGRSDFQPSHLAPMQQPGNASPQSKPGFITGLSPSNGKTVDRLTVVDRFSKANHFIPLPKLPSARETATIVLDNVSRIHGLPVNMVSDRGPQFVSKFWTEFCRQLGATASLSSRYPPQTNSQAEQANQDLERVLRCVVSAEPSSWSSRLTMVKRSPHSDWREEQGIGGPSPYQATTLRVWSEGLVVFQRH